MLGGHAVKHFPEQVFRRLDGFEFVADAALKSRIHKVIGVHVGREDDGLVKRDREALTCVQSEKVDTAVERHDPTVEDVFRFGALAAEVIDQVLASCKFEGIKSQFTNDNVDDALTNLFVKKADNKTLGMIRS